MGARVNGTYHAAARTGRARLQTRLLIGAGAFMGVLGVLNVVLTHRDMDQIEQAGPPRLALAGSGIERYVPSLLLNLPRANAPPTTVNAPASTDPRRSPQYVGDKRTLERWMAVLGFGLAALFVGLEQTVPARSSAARQPIGSDLARLLVLLAIAYAALSFFESG